jgi:hypothetical protein
MPIGVHKMREIDGKKCFARWVELGSCSRVSAEMTRMPYHPSAIYTAIMRYVSEHPDEARPVFISQDIEFARNDSEWWTYVVRKTWTRMKSMPSAFVDWMDKWELSLDNYSEIFSDYFQFLKKLRVEMKEKRKLGK